MYKVIGADGKEYGPVSAEVLREWIGQGRANGATRVLAEGSAEWKTLGELAEFGPTLARAATPMTPAPLPITAPAPGTPPLATIGLVLGIFSITVGLCCCNGFPFNLAGVICSAVALAQINKDPVQRPGRGVAIAGLIISVLSLLFSGLLLALWGLIMAMPNAVHNIHRL